MSMKKRAFTLGEVLIALSVVALVAVLTIPALLGDIAAKHRMAKLTNDVANLDYAIQTYMRENHLSSFSSSEGSTHFNQFKYREYLDTKESDKNKTDYNGKYKKLNGGDADFTTEAGWSENSDSNVRVLSNGTTLFRRYTSDYSEVFIDVNGTDPPNVYGLDAFIARVYYKNVTDDGKILVRAGTVTGYPQGKEPAGDLKTLCENGDATACYTWAERHNFAYNYLDPE